MVFALAVLRPILGLVLGVIVFFGFLSFVVVSGFRGNFLSTEFYAENISENSVYDRIYDEVLLDPDFEKQTDYLVAGVEVPHEDVVEVTRSILPPTYLQDQVENALSGALDYLKRDSEDPLVFIELGPPIDNIKPTVLAYIDRRIDEIPTKEVDDAEEMADMLAILWKDLEEGLPPQAIPALRDPSSLNDSIADLIFDRAIEELEADPEFPQSAVNGLLEQGEAIKVSLVAVDMKGVLKTAASSIASPVINRALSETVDEIPTKEVEGAVEMAEELAFLWKELEEGRIPETIPVLRDPTSLSDSVADLIFDLAIQELEAEPGFPGSAVNALREQEAAIKVPLGEGDIKAALKTTAGTIASPLIDETIAEFVAEELDEDRRLDLVEVAAESGNKTRQEFLDSLEPARDYIETTSLGLTLTIVAVVVGSLLLGALQYPHMGSLFRLPGIVLFVSGAVCLIVAIVVKPAVEGLLDTLLNRVADEEPGIPTSIIDIISDVFGSMSSDIVWGVVPSCATAMGVGLALIVVSVLIRKLPIPIFSR